MNGWQALDGHNFSLVNSALFLTEAVVKLLFGEKSPGAGWEKALGSPPCSSDSSQPIHLKVNN